MQNREWEVLKSILEQMTKKTLSPEIEDKASKRRKTCMQSSTVLVENRISLLLSFHSGKFSKDHQLVAIKSQGNVTCLLSAMRRLSVFSEGRSEIELSDYYQAYKIMKHALNEYQPGVRNDQKILDVMENACRMMKLNVNVIAPIHAYPMLTTRWQILYFELVRQILPMFGNVASHSKPTEDIDEFKDSLKSTGPRMFVGKYGAFFYKAAPKTLSQQDNDSRILYYFLKDTFINNPSFTHCVIVDEVRLFNDIPMIVFRDPKDASIPGQPEKVYMLSYKAFLERMAWFNGASEEDNIYSWYSRSTSP